MNDYVPDATCCTERPEQNSVKFSNESLRFDWKHNCAEKVDTGLRASSQDRVGSGNYCR